MEIDLRSVPAWNLYVSLSKRLKCKPEILNETVKEIVWQSAPVDPALLTEEMLLTRELQEACSRGDVAEVTRLLFAGANPKLEDLSGQNCMNIAAMHAHHGVVKVLLVSPIPDKPPQLFHICPWSHGNRCSTRNSTHLSTKTSSIYVC